MAGFTAKVIDEAHKIDEQGSTIAVYETEAGTVGVMVTLKYADGSFMSRKYPDGRHTPMMSIDQLESIVAVFDEIKASSEKAKAALAAKGPKAPKGAAKPPSAAQQQQLVMMEIMQQMLAELRAGKKSK